MSTPLVNGDENIAKAKVPGNTPTPGIPADVNRPVRADCIRPDKIGRSWLSSVDNNRYAGANDIPTDVNDISVKNKYRTDNVLSFLSTLSILADELLEHQKTNFFYDRLPLPLPDLNKYLANGLNHINELLRDAKNIPITHSNITLRQ